MHQSAAEDTQNIDGVPTSALHKDPAVRDAQTQIDTADTVQEIEGMVGARLVEAVERVLVESDQWLSLTV